MVRNGQKHRHRIAVMKKASASHRHQKLTIAEVYTRAMLKALLIKLPFLPVTLNATCPLAKHLTVGDFNVSLFFSPNKIMQL